MTADLSPLSPALVIVVDVANVMGARADGWWRDRAGAALRLVRDIGALAARGLPAADSAAPDNAAPDAAPASAPPDRVFPRYVLVLEGRARDAAARAGAPDPRMRVVRAPGAGDDTIAAEAAAAARRGPCLVVSADRELRERCRAAGASARGPEWLLDLL